MKTTIRRRVRNAESERRILDDSSAEYIILFNGTGTQKGFVNSKLEDKGRAELSLDDVLLDCERYRLVFRDIANATNERSLIATVIPLLELSVTTKLRLSVHTPLSQARMT